MTVRSAVLLLGLLAFAPPARGPSAASGTEPVEVEAPRDDVLVILLDDVGKEALAAYGGEAPAHTPVLDRLAREGIVYDRAYASPQCSPSRALLVTGRYGFRTGFGSNARHASPFDGGLDGASVPDRLRAAPSVAAHGVSDEEADGGTPDAAPAEPFVAWYGKWHLVTSGAADADDHPVAVGGFERFVGHLGNLGSEDGEEEDTHHYRWRRVEAGRAGSRATLIDGDVLGYDEGAWASAACQRALSRDLAALDPLRPALTVFAPVAPHSPEQSPPAALVSKATSSALPLPASFERTGRKRRGLRGMPRATYLAQIEALDTLIGRVLDALPSERRARTTVIVFGDNGAPGGLLPKSLNPEHGKGGVYEQGIGVPLIVAGPRVTRPGSRCDAFVHLIDVPATAAEILGRAAIGGDGRSFAATLADPAGRGARTNVFCEIFSPNGRGVAEASAQRAVVERRYKLLRRTVMGRSTDELYDLETDPLEAHDLLGEGAALTDDARAALERLGAELDAVLAG